MNRLITLTIQYYRSILLYNIAFFVLAVVLILFGVGANAGGLLFCKLIAIGGAMGLHYFSSTNTFFYYRNAGLSIRRLYGFTLLMDLAVFIIIALPLNLIAHAAAHLKG